MRPDFDGLIAAIEAEWERTCAGNRNSNACESCRVFEDVIEGIRGYAARSTTTRRARGVTIPLDDAARLATLAEVGANAMTGASRSAAIQRVRSLEAAVVTARAR